MCGNLRKTKIICTIGPASCDKDVLRELMKSGMDVARFNFSHGEYETFEKWLKNVEEVREELGLPVATLLDTKGPEIRLGTFKNPKGVILKEGQAFTLTTDEIEGDEERCSVSYKGLVNDVKNGTQILINDGLIALEVQSVKDKDIITNIRQGGK